MRLSELCLMLLLACLLLLPGCSERSSPTGPVLPDPGPTPSPTPTPPPGQANPIILSSDNHPDGWGRSECLACHQPNLLPLHQGLGQAQCLGCHGDNGTDPGYELCVVCHGKPPLSGAHSRHQALSLLDLQCGDCHRGAGLDNPELHRDGRVQVALGPAWDGSYSAGSCTGTFCHGVGSPRWYEDQGLGCIDCHDATGSSALGAFSGRHASHAGSLGQACTVCHSAPPSSHYNGSLDNPDRIRPDGGSYSDSTPGGYSPNGSSGTCSDLEVGCHGFTAEWTLGDTCNACHPATAAMPPGSGSHARHASASALGYPCSHCHVQFPDRHPDFNIDVGFDASVIPGGGRWNGSSCSQLYCHGGGAAPTSGGDNTSPTWGDPSTVYCGSCHAATAEDPPTSGSHQRHAGASGQAYPCSHCHVDWPSGHVDFDVDQRFDSTALPGNGVRIGESCSVYCHGSGNGPLPPAGGDNTQPVWGAAGSVVCGSCHGAPGGSQGYPPNGQHDFHVGLLGYNCNRCHEQWPVGHVDGVRTIDFQLPDAVYTPAAQPNQGSCSMVECHFEFPNDDRQWGN